MFYHSCQHTCSHASRYELAALLSMKVESPEFEAIVAEIPSNDPSCWSSENPVHRGYKNANLRQYEVAYVRGLVEGSNTEKDSDTLQMWAQKDSKELSSSVFQMLPSSSSGSSSDAIAFKVEVPEMTELKALSPTLHKHSRDMLAMASTLRVLLSQLKASKKPESHIAKFLIVCAVVCLVLSPLLEAFCLRA
jgi:hypothetical protein